MSNYYYIFFICLELRGGRSGLFELCGAERVGRGQNEGVGRREAYGLSRMEMMTLGGVGMEVVQPV